MRTPGGRASARNARATAGFARAGAVTAWVWLAVVSFTMFFGVVSAQFSPPPSPPPPPPSPPPPSPPPPNPPPPSPPPATGFIPIVRVLGATNSGNEALVTTSDCCQWYKWCDNTNVTYQCTSVLLTACDAVLTGGGTWNATCAACGMCRDSQGSAEAMFKKSRLPIDHAYQACIDTRRTVKTRTQIADPTITNQSVGFKTQIARDYTNKHAPDFVVCGTLNYKCLKQRSSAKPGNPCEVIPGVKIPGTKHSSVFGKSTDASEKDPRRGPVAGRLNLGSGMMVYDTDRDFDKVADMHDRETAGTHTGFEYPHGVTK